MGARAGLDYESVQKLAFVDYLACSAGGRFFRCGYAGWLTLMVALRRTDLASVTEAEDLPLRYLMDLLTEHGNWTQR